MTGPSLSWWQTLDLPIDRISAGHSCCRPRIAAMIGRRIIGGDACLCFRCVGVRGFFDCATIAVAQEPPKTIGIRRGAVHLRSNTRSVSRPTWNWQMKHCVFPQSSLGSRRGAKDSTVTLCLAIRIEAFTRLAIEPVASANEPRAFVDITMAANANPKTPIRKRASTVILRLVSLLCGAPSDAGANNQPPSRD